MKCDDIKPNSLKRYYKQKKSVTDELSSVGLQPNNSQYGCAVAALYKTQNSRSIISVPTGKGKSRIIAAVVALAASMKSA